jgi:hypothetical protein
VGEPARATNDMIAKLSLVEKDLTEYSREAVQVFHSRFDGGGLYDPPGQARRCLMHLLFCAALFARTTTLCVATPGASRWPRKSKRCVLLRIGADDR